MADFLKKESGIKSAAEQDNSSSKSQDNDVKVDQENMETITENCPKNYADSVSVWSPPNTPPNKYAFPRFPSLSPQYPRRMSDVDVKEAKVTPPRGRPKAEMINHLIVEGAQSCSPIRCDICGRVFPREKSLQAHKRTHSGDRPYTCDFPNCDKAFVQSGQLKTHQRLHTGEKPFICTVESCDSRFTHANRHCPTHPKAGLVRKDCDDIPLKRTLLSEIQNQEPNKHTKEVLMWLNKYERERQNKSPGSLKCKKERRELDRDRERNQLGISERRRARVEARKRIAEQKERWFGALALVELAELTANAMPVHKSLNFHFPREDINHVELI
ncbi:zinc finger protein 367-like [Dendronephthya gigantea]|uniref:zinc finger protein 367-like n=1 Tax=Dendronephthya gigantea TaxID=151771 RepID=UPI00106C7D4C|nr:zinc finger protein 367-like [Dendronephthya gigantea]